MNDKTPDEISFLSSVFNWAAMKSVGQFLKHCLGKLGIDQELLSVTQTLGLKQVGNAPILYVFLYVFVLPWNKVFSSTPSQGSANRMDLEKTRPCSCEGNKGLDTLSLMVECGPDCHSYDDGASDGEYNSSNSTHSHFCLISSFLIQCII